MIEEVSRMSLIKLKICNLRRNKTKEETKIDEYVVSNKIIFLSTLFTM